MKDEQFEKLKEGQRRLGLMIIIIYIFLGILMLLSSCYSQTTIYVKSKGQITFTDSTMIIQGPATIKPRK